MLAVERSNPVPARIYRRVQLPFSDLPADGRIKTDDLIHAAISFLEPFECARLGFDQESPLNSVPVSRQQEFERVSPPSIIRADLHDVCRASLEKIGAQLMKCMESRSQLTDIHGGIAG